MLIIQHRHWARGHNVQVEAVISGASEDKSSSEQGLERMWLKRKRHKPMISTGEFCSQGFSGRTRSQLNLVVGSGMWIAE